MLKGYKTYITAAVAVITAWGMFLSGDDTLMQAVQLTFTALIGAFVRSAVTTEAAK